MVNTIIIKNDDTAGNTPADNELVTGELAVNTADGKLFYGDDSGNAQEFSMTGIALTDLSVGSEGSASGDGAIAYNNSTGVFVYTPPVHDSLSGFVAAEHYRWDNDISSTATIHANNIPTLNQNTSGTAAIATTVTVTDNEDTNENNVILFGAGAAGSGNIGVEADGNMTYNPSTGKITATGFVGALTGDASGNAATATALATARNIGGVSFDGSDDIDLPGVNSAGNQNTTGNAATATKLAATKTIAGVAFDGSANISLNNNSITNGAGYTTNTGDITGVTAGNGLTGGGSSGGVTVTVGAGDGITVNSNDVAVTAAQTTVTSMLNSSLVVGRDSHNQIDFSTDNQIKFKTNNETPVIIMKASGEIEATKFDGALEGNADTATALATARTIGGVSFDGSANITVSSATGAFTAAGILKTDDTTEATSTTDGSLQTDGGLSVAKSAVIGDDLDLLSNSAIFKIGNAQPFTLTHSNSNNTAMVSSGHRLAFGDNGEFITGDGTNMTISTSGDFRLDCGDDIELDITDNGSTFRIKDDGTVFFRVNPSDGHVDLDADGAEIHFGANEEIQLVHVHDVGLKLTETGGGTPTLQFVDANESVSSDGSNLILTSGGTAFKVPTSDGSSGHFLKTDGSGNLSFAAVSSGSGDITSVVAGTGMTGGATSGDATVNVIGGTGITANANDIQITDGGVDTTQLADGGVTNAKLAGSIDDSKLSTITTTNKVHVAALDIDGATDIGEALVDADLFIVDNGANSTERKATMSRLKTYIENNIGTLNQNTTGSAATLTTARNIGGVSFNGSANINLPGVNTSGNQDTSGNAATATALTSGNKTIAGVLDITDDTEASDDSGDTGALRVEGGASIAKKVFVGGDLDVDGTTNLDVVDIDGAVDMATTLTLGGNADFNGDLDVDGTTNLDVVDIDGAVDMASTLAMGDHITMATDKKIIFRATDIFMHSNSANDLKITTPADLLISANGIITYDSDQHDFGESTTSDVVFNFNTSGNDGRLTWDQSADTFVFDKAVDALSFKINGTAISATAAELNIMDGVTATAAELNILDGCTATASELNALDGISATVGELNLLDGGTSVGSSITIGDNDGFIVNDGGTMKLIPASDISTYAGGGASTGNYSFSANTMSNSNAMTIDCGNDINLDADGGDIVLKDAGTTYGSLTNNGGGLIVKSGTTSVMMYDSSGSPAINNNAIKQIGAWIFGHSNLDNSQGTYISWSSSNSNQSDVFNHRALMPAKGKIVAWTMKTDGGLSGLGTPPMTIVLSGSSTSGQSDATHSDDAGRFTNAVSSAEDLTGLIGYEWEAGDTITGVITPTAGSNQRAQSSALIEWTY